MPEPVIINATVLQRKLARLSVLSNKDMPELVREGARRFTQNAVRNTPPMILSSTPASAKKAWTDRVTSNFETYRIGPDGYRSDTAVRKLLAAKKHQLGREAAGWNAAATDLKASRIPSWVARHGESEGICDIIRRGDRFSITVVNRVPYNEYMTRERAKYALARTERGFDGAIRALTRKLIRSLR